MAFKFVRKPLIASLCAVLFVLAGCSSDTGTSENAENEGKAAFDLWLGWAATVNNNSLIQQYWRDTDPKVEVKTEAAQGDATTALNLKLNTGGFKDAALFGRSTTVDNAMRKSNLLMPLEQYFDMPDKYPNLAQIPKEYLEQMKDGEGHIWSIPTYFDRDPVDPWKGWASNSWFVRSDILEKTGLKESDLQTIAGIETYLEKASELTDESGKKLLPLGILIDSNDENAVLASFGVTTAAAGGITPVSEKDGQIVFQYEDPGYKQAYAWLNKAYREGWLDPESLTDKKERYTEKNKSGRYAMNAGSFWNLDASLWEQLNGPTAPGWFYAPIAFPKVEGIDRLGTSQVINPYPAYDTYVSKNTKNIDAILKFYDYALGTDPAQGFAVSEGPEGKYWGWTGEPYGKWDYIDADYKEKRNAGDAAKKAGLTPELWQITNYGKEWYAWWNYGGGEYKGASKTAEFSEKIGEMGSTRVAEPYDQVKPGSGGAWERYGPELESVRKEYKAKLILAKDDAEFEKAWTDFNSAMEARAHWSELKQEWNDTYQTMISK
ncbi:hypothetical protein [Saccharibacillus sacchari]|uniref:hypothetical protein n=1 Tax=Saccharibacillus sacchari TaxID=456493 RepID=UPI0004AF96A9|nr:hypothetical protein [Saccharibacillus sacchari]